MLMICDWVRGRGGGASVCELLFCMSVVVANSNQVGRIKSVIVNVTGCHVYIARVDVTIQFVLNMNTS